MDNLAVKEIINSIVGPGRVLENEPMSKHTTLRVGGNAAFFVSPQAEDEVVALLKALSGTEYIVIGNGSNVLFPDDGYDGVVINLGSNFSKITVEGNDIIAQGGALLSKIAATALEHGLGGFEFASGIPGSIGGAVAMNAGAYGREMKDVVVSSLCVGESGNIIEIEDHEFAYRRSIITDTKLVVLSTKIHLEPKDPALIRAQMAELNAKRREKQPLEYPSAGSTFKRPEGHFAGKLIEEAALKGYRIGGAMVSEKHAGFVINYDHATSKDIYELIEHIKKEVYMRFGVELEPEIKLIGEVK